jgi:Heavy metal associated domain 2
MPPGVLSPRPPDCSARLRSLLYDYQVHYLPGRVRVKLPRLKGNASLAGEVERTLAALQGVCQVETSTTTGSVLVLYEPRLLVSLDLEAVGALMELAHTLGLSFEERDMDLLQHWVHAAAHGTGTRAETPTTLGSTITACFGAVNAGVTQITSGWGELQTLVPLTLAFLGLRGLLLTDNLPFPTWYDYLWFAFSTFVVLNGPRATRAADQRLDTPGAV